MPTNFPLDLHTSIRCWYHHSPKFTVHRGRNQKSGIFMLFCCCRVIVLSSTNNQWIMKKTKEIFHFQLAAAAVSSPTKVLMSVIQCKLSYGTLIMILLQGPQQLSVQSNLAMTDRKNVINFNLKGFSVQGRLGIYPWMIIMIISWPPLASLTSNLTSPIF